MPAVEDVAGCENRLVSGALHPQGRRHDLVGANRPMVALLEQLYGNTGTGEIPNFYFDMTLERMDEFLPSAATLDVEFPDLVDLDAGIPELVVTVTNRSGHKLPSGYSEGRVMWLEVVARYADEVVYASGRWDGTSIEDDAQVRRYEAIAEDSVDGTTLHLLRNDRWVVDSRIPPLGLMPDIETDPVGDRYALRGDGTWSNADRVAYTFAPAHVEPLVGAADELVIDVRLLYLINTPEYLEFLARENVTNGAGDFVNDAFAEHGAPQPLLLASASATVPLVGLGGSETGSSDDSAGTNGESTGSTATTDASEEGSTNAVTEGEGEDDTSTGNTGNEGCACRAHGDARGVAPLLLVLPWLATRRRRRSYTADS